MSAHANEQREKKRSCASYCAAHNCDRPLSGDEISTGPAMAKKFQQLDWPIGYSRHFYFYRRLRRSHRFARAWCNSDHRRRICIWFVERFSRGLGGTFIVTIWVTKIARDALRKTEATQD